MSRDILFRGVIENDESREFFGNWFYGDLINYSNGDTFIRQRETGSLHEVITETVGQFTGMLDKNKTRIFEGDIIEMSGGLNLEIYPTKGAITYSVNSFVMKGLNPNNTFMNMSLNMSDGTKIEVIGNIIYNLDVL